MNNKKTILCLGSLPPPYMGPTIASEIILNSKLKNEFNLVHLDTSDHRGLDSLGSLDIRNILLTLKHYIAFIWLLITRKPAMIYMQICQTTLGYLRDVVFILISKIFCSKIICHLRGGNFRNWYMSSGSFLQAIIRKTHSLVDGQIVLGENLRKMFKDILPNQKIFVVPNGKNVAYTPKNKDYTKIRIMFLSNFIYEKGIVDVLKAVPYVYKAHRNIEFIFVGGWWDKYTKIEIKKFLYRHQNLPINIKGLVSGDAKFRFLFQSDIFIFPTYYPPEGHPWVIVEAMAAGLPIITTDQGAITESVKDGVNGFIVEKRNPKEIAEKIKVLIDNPDLRKKMGRESRRLYLENFTEDKMIEKLSYAFRAVLSR